MTTLMDPEANPKTKVEASVMLSAAGERLGYDLEGSKYERDYYDHKARQWFEAMADYLIAEAYLDGWFADLGCGTCQVEDSSIGGIPCLSSSET